MKRVKASLIHLAISTIVVGAVLVVVFFYWYPGPLIRVAGAVTPVLVLVAVNVVLGPTLTMIVFKPGKPGLKFDLAVITLLQLAALVYGTWVLYGERPHFLVFAVDRFEAIPLRHVDSSKIQYAELLEAPRSGELIRVHARLPEDPVARQRLLESVMFDNQPDLERRTEYWEPYGAGADVLRGALRPLADFPAASPAEAAALALARERFANERTVLGLLPLVARDHDVSVLIDSQTLEPLAIVDVNAWEGG